MNEKSETENVYLYNILDRYFLFHKKFCTFLRHNGNNEIHKNILPLLLNM